jgi:hypothetical protein
VIEVQVKWPVNPFRSERFAAGWLPAAEAVLRYGATHWSFARNYDGRLDFIQTAHFPTKAHFERYWYSEEISAKRVEMSGYYQVPIVPTMWEILGSGDAVEPEAEILGAHPAEPGASA